jgi:site-specific DNA-methyltransferase (adenine-specific)
MSDGELAWTSLDIVTRQIKANRFKIKLEGSIHPTQKPVYLYKHLLEKYAKEGDKILDTHLGSGSSRIAAYIMGFDFYGCEIDQDYFNAQEKRFKEQTAQQSLFNYEKTA